MKKNKKIIIAAEIFPPDIGGPATYVKRLAEELIKLSYLVEVFTYGEEKQNLAYPVKYISRQIPFLLRQLIYFLRLLPSSFNASVIYAQGPSIGPAAILAKWLSGTKVVVKYVGDQSWQQIRVKGKLIKFEQYMADYGKQWWDVKTWWIQRWQRFSLRHANAVITPSQYLSNILIKYLKVKHEKITVIPNIPTFTAAANKQVTEQAVLYFGRIENWKGIETLIKAVEGLPSYKLYLAGKGNELAKYKALVSEKNLSDRIIFTGKLDHDELVKYFHKCFCFVLGSEYEGMPFSVLEAWSYSLPVIVSDFPANIELVENEKTGLVFEYGNAIQLKTAIARLWENPNLRNRLEAAALKKLKQYSINQMTEETLEVLIK